MGSLLPLYLLCKCMDFRNIKTFQCDHIKTGKLSYLNREFIEHYVLVCHFHLLRQRYSAARCAAMSFIFKFSSSPN